jgi:hypothetical protein
MLANFTDVGADQCTWASTERLIVFLTPSSTISFNSVSPSFIAGSIGSYLHPVQDYQFVKSDNTVTIVAPSNPIQPTAVITAAPGLSLGRCDELFLSGSASSGAGGRALTASWNVDSYACTMSSCDLMKNEIITNMTKLMNATRTASSSLSIPKSLLYEGATLSVSLTVQNWALMPSLKVVATIEIESAIKPTVSIDGIVVGAVVSGKRSAFTRLYGYGSQPTCGGAELGASSMTFKWSVQQKTTGSTDSWADLSDQLVGTLQTSNNPLNMIVAPYLLDAGLTYRFTITGSMLSSPSVSNAAWSQ